MQKTVIARYVRVSEKKLRMATRGVCGMNAQQALSILTLARNNAARVIGAVLKNGIALFPPSTDKQSLHIRTILIDKGPRLKRWRPGGRGVAKRYERKTAHITVTLEDNGK